MKNLLILEDNLEHCRQLEHLVRLYNSESDIVFDVTAATSVTDAANWLKKHPADAFLLDISMDNTPGNNEGLAFARYLRSTPEYQKKPILFITAYGSFLPEALNELHCYAFLMKPYTKEDLFRQLYDLSHSREELYIKNRDNIYIRCPLDSLQYIQANGRYLKYVTTDGVFYSRQYTLNGLTEKLPADFVRCHKSYVINKKQIDNCDFVNRYIELRDCPEKIPVSRNIKPDAIFEKNL